MNSFTNRLSHLGVGAAVLLSVQVAWAGCWKFEEDIALMAYVCVGVEFEEDGKPVCVPKWYGEANWCEMAGTLAPCPPAEYCPGCRREPALPVETDPSCVTVESFVSAKGGLTHILAVRPRSRIAAHEVEAWCSGPSGRGVARNAGAASRAHVRSTSTVHRAVAASYRAPIGLQERLDEMIRTQLSAALR
jgi:hypothetical protein